MSKISFILVDRPDSFGTFEQFTDAFRRIKDLGFRGVEFNLTEPLGFDIGLLSKHLESLDLPLVSFLTGTNYFVQGLCLSSPRAEIRERAVARLCEFTSIAGRFGAVLVVGQMQGFLSDEPDKSVGEAHIEEGMKRVAEAAEQNRVTIAFEPVNHLQAGFNNTSAEVMALADRIGSTYFKPMLDTFHMNIEEKSMTEPIFRVGSNLGHFHLCESNGSLLGTGHFDVQPIFAALDAIKYDGYVSVKVYRQPWTIAAPATAAHLKQLGMF